MPRRKHKILVIHGPNLNLLGEREEGIYGKTSLKEIDTMVKKRGSELNVLVESFQSNSEGDIVSAIQEAGKKYAGLIINPAAYTHTSVSIRDALLAVAIPAVEVHLSNIYQREAFRKHSFIAPAVIGQISGFGPDSYLLALEVLAKRTRPGS